MKILTVVGARPQFIKAAVFSKAVKQNNKHQHTKIDELIVNTEQHFDSDMSDIFFNQLEIPTPKYSCSTILKSEFEKNTLSIKEEKNLNIIPVPTSVMKEPTNLLGNLSSISFFFYITFIKHPNNRID